MSTFLTWEQQRRLARQVRSLRGDWDCLNGRPLFLAALWCHRRAVLGIGDTAFVEFTGGDETALAEVLAFSPSAFNGAPLDAEARAFMASSVDSLWHPDLREAWVDPLSVGWVFQYYNDPDRKRLDDKVAKRGKIEPGEVASKTQLFTERYMCDWLLANSVGAVWRQIVAKNGWKVSDSKLWVDRPPEGTLAIDSIRDIKLLDPAVGTGNFLVIAFDLLLELNELEAGFRGTEWCPGASAQHILEHNLFGVDIDAEAVQIAKIVLWWRARDRGAKPGWMNLVAPPEKIAMESIHKWAATWAIESESVQEICAAVEQLPALGTLSPLSAVVDKVMQGVPHPVRAEQDLALLMGEQVESEILPFTAPVSRLLGLYRMLRGDQYHVVVANPPYLGIKKMGSPGPIEKLYPRSKADLFAVFIERGEALLRLGGFNAMVTLHNWMFLSSFVSFRQARAQSSALEVCAHLGLGGGFSGWSDNNVVMQTAMFVYRKGGKDDYPTRWLRLDQYPNDQKSLALREGRGLWVRAVADLAEIADQPLIYWWEDAVLAQYLRTPKLAEQSSVRQGLATSNNKRFVRFPWEVREDDILQLRVEEPRFDGWGVEWVPFIKGAAGKSWFEPLSDIIAWRRHGLELKLHAQKLYGSYTRTIKNEGFYFKAGVSYSTIGSEFRARLRRWQSVFDVSGSAVFPENPMDVVCLLNSERAQLTLRALNPTANFQVGDVNRLALFPVLHGETIIETLEEVFRKHEQARETSLHFVAVGESCWVGAQDWATKTVNKAPGSPLIPYTPVRQAPSAKDQLSYAFGVAIGRFSAGEGVLFIGPEGSSDSLSDPSSAQLCKVWEQFGSELPSPDLRSWLRYKFFSDDHLSRYRKRPIYWPLSSKRRSFVVWVSAHEFHRGLLQKVVSERLLGVRDQLHSAELVTELDDFMGELNRVGRLGPPQASPKDPSRELDLPLSLFVNDGIRVSCGALWSLLEPQWKEPRSWWSELCRGVGRADCDWSELAARYFPKRVVKKCAVDASIAAAHERLWRDHPRAAYEWECRFSEEFERVIRIDEPGADSARTRFEGSHSEVAAAMRAAPRRRVVPRE